MVFFCSVSTSHAKNNRDYWYLKPSQTNVEKIIIIMLYTRVHNYFPYSYSYDNNTNMRFEFILLTYFFFTFAKNIKIQMHAKKVHTTNHICDIIKTAFFKFFNVISLILWIMRYILHVIFDMWHVDYWYIARVLVGVRDSFLFIGDLQFNVIIEKEKFFDT